MKISFFGAAEEVGRSCIMVTTKNSKILLDAGVKLGSDDQYPKITDEMLNEIDGIFISHAHLDHSGYLPHIMSAGYKNKVYATKPTMELIQVLLSDYMRLSKPSNVTKAGLERLVKSYHVLEYKQAFKFRDLTVTFIPAGHILGSALIKIDDGEKSLIYTGDINIAKTKLFNGADLRNLSADVLITESTYGGESDIFKPQSETINSMVKSIRETIKAGGKVIIPSFAVGRAQEVLLILDDYMNSGMIPKVTIYVDGMINKAMRIHRHNVIYCKKELQSKILMSDYDPFKSDNFEMVEKKGTRTRIVNDDQSSIIVTTSGMITGGPIMFYLSKLASNSMNKMILVGYQAEGTMGRDLQEGAREIEIDNKKIKIEMDVELYHLSAHADRHQLETIPEKISGLKKIFILHGEITKSSSLKSAFSDRYETIIPKLEESFTI
ncbi:MAG: MBL fold metallo-hydrolase [Candidatus Marsarchaeota archaeon]|nr:MBL fold metallo-hydrolase [Candidatus Marsarchaeota archaeon]